MQIALSDAIQTFVPAGIHPINAPHVVFSTIDLTGDGGTVFITISLDHKNTWQNGILQNSRYLKLKVDGGKLSCVSKGRNLPTFRKVKAATAEEAVAKINRYIDKVEEEANAIFDDPNWVGATCHY